MQLLAGTSMLKLKLFAYTPFAITGILASSDPMTNTFVEYGALGICAFSVAMLFRQLSDIRQTHKDERASLVDALRIQNESHKEEREKLVQKLSELNCNLVDLLEKSIRSDDKLTEALKNRPCLIK